ncbi:MFS transporter [Vagococcus coleopterorum]|uniref:MFS transporter n=1 Tax=Vagococcus coleopterorum TaxID=2714946 RepID=A0A6G8ANW9_9ENTE|nr:MFS transporter [Vagococcus coleopterorum]QIL46625.1 MFS transporter [Vagococcus coleopterorum]
MTKQTITMTKQLTFIMALVCGISIASLYYVQPLEGMIANELGVQVGQMGLAPTLSQIGYALGLLLIVPLGDIFQRKKLIVLMLSLVSLVLLATGLTSSYAVLMPLMLAIGLTSIIPQLIIPFAGQLAKPEERGAVLGTVTSGLLIGILLSRTFSGFIGEYFGWRSVYYSGVGLSVVLIILVTFIFPKNKPVSNLSYGALLKSLPKLFTSQRIVRESAFNGFFMFGAFSIFWSTLIFYMESPVYNMGSKEVGYIGLVGVIGALASVLMGKVSDKRGPRFGVGLGSLILTGSYLVLWAFGSSLVGLVIGVILLDLGTQSAQVSNQSRIQSLGDENRSRNNTIFMFSYFVGGASGSLLGSFAWQIGGWSAVCILGLIYGAIGLFGHYVIYKK